MHASDAFFVQKSRLKFSFGPRPIKFTESLGKEPKILYGCDVTLRMTHLAAICFLLELWSGRGAVHETIGSLKVLANEDTLLLMMFPCARKLGNICCGHEMFLNKIGNIFVSRTLNLCPQQMLRARGNNCVGNNVSSFAWALRNHDGDGEDNVD